MVDSALNLGFEYVSHEYSTKLIPGTAGCFGIGARADATQHVGCIKRNILIEIYTPILN